MSQVDRAGAVLSRAKALFDESRLPFYHQDKDARRWMRREVHRAERRYGRAVLAAEVKDYEDGEYRIGSADDDYSEGDWCSACGGVCVES